MKKIIQLLLCVIIMVSFTACSKQKASTTSTSSKTEVQAIKKDKLSNIENDADIIYNMSYNHAYYLNGKSTDSIKINKKSNKTTYNFVEHVLSCGTHMNGNIVENVDGKTKTIKGSFNVTKNPYKITDLEINIKINTETDKQTGYIIVNGEKLDINSNFQPI